MDYGSTVSQGIPNSLAATHLFFDFAPLSRPAGMYACTYTFSPSDYDFYTSAEQVTRTPPFYCKRWNSTAVKNLFSVAKKSFGGTAYRAIYNICVDELYAIFILPNDTSFECHWFYHRCFYSK